MATDLNKSLNLDTLISNLDEVIKRITMLNTDLSQLTKTSENAAKSTDQLNSAQKQSEKIVNDLTVQEIQLAKLQDEVIKTGEKLTVVHSEENEQLIKNRIALQEANKAIKEKIKAEQDNSKSSDQLTKALNTNATTIKEAEAQNRILRKAVKDVDTTTAEGLKTIVEYNTVIEKNDKLINDVSDAYIQQKRNIGAYNTALDGIKDGFNNATASAKAFLANPIGAVIAGLTAAFGALKNALNSTEEGQRLLTQATGFLNGVLAGLNEIVIALIDPLVRLFTDPTKAVEDFQQAIKDKIFGVFEELKNIGLGVGKILSGIWERDLDKIKEGAKDAGTAFANVVKETNPLVQIGAKIVESTQNTLTYATELSRIEAERFDLEKQRNQLIIDEANISRDIAQARQIANDAEVDSRTQLEAIRKAESLISELAQRRIADKKEQLRLLVEEQDLGSGNLQDSREYAELQAEIIKLEEQEANTLRTVSKRRAAILSSIEREKELLEELTLQKEIAVDAELLGLQSIAELKNRTALDEEENNNKLNELNKLSTEQKLDGAIGLANQSADLTNQIFEDEKSAAYAKASINIAEGITKAISSKGFLGIAQGALISAAGAVQLAKIAGTQYFKGTESAKKGLAWVSERGAEIIEDKNGNMNLIPDMSLVNLQGGEKVYTAQETKKMLFDDSRIIKELRRQKQNIIVNIKKESYASKYAFKA